MDAAFARAYVEAGIMPLEEYAMLRKGQVLATADPVPSFQHPVRCLQIVEAENAALKDENQRLRIRLQTISDLANAPVGAQP